MARFWCWIILLGGIPAVVAEDGIVVDHSTNRDRGSSSDTAIYPSGALQWQQAADDIMVSSPATIRHVTWWGFYYDVVPSTETMRVRLYVARLSDGLPGDVLYEQNIINPWRGATGDIIPFIPPGTGSTAAEYRFEADLPVSMSLGAGVPYWLEIVQVGDIDSIFVWRDANIEQTGVGIVNSSSGDWMLQGGPDMAFQLSTIPEPSMLILMVFAISFRWKKIWPTNY